MHGRFKRIEELKSETPRVRSPKDLESCCGRSLSRLKKQRLLRNTREGLTAIRFVLKSQQNSVFEITLVSVVCPPGLPNG